MSDQVQVNQEQYDAQVSELLGRHVRVVHPMANGSGLVGVVIGARWRADSSPYGGGPGSYPVYVVCYAAGVTEGGISAMELEVIETPSAPFFQRETLRWAIAAWNLIGWCCGLYDVRTFCSDDAIMRSGMGVLNLPAEVSA